MFSMVISVISEVISVISVDFGDFGESCYQPSATVFSMLRYIENTVSDHI